MKLSPAERLILSNQYQILAALDQDSTETYGEFREILECGYELLYFRLFHGVSVKSLSETDCNEVVDTLAMFQAIKNSVESMTDKPLTDTSSLKFDGYEGIKERDDQLFARFFCESDGGRFEDLEIKAFSSALPRRDEYQRMVARWRELGKNRELTKIEIEELAKARLNAN
ncbi:MAG: hypothetical protein JWM11_5906 [Planctomycetaceae bacterium]|nr:hypothetical protein [Planctomycetaceae bacterium]